MEDGRYKTSDLRKLVDYLEKNDIKDFYVTFFENIQIPWGMSSYHLKFHTDTITATLRCRLLDSDYPATITKETNL